MRFYITDTEVASTCSRFFCDAIPVISTPLELVGVLSVGLTVLLMIGHAQDGIETCQDERERLSAERDAFQTFLNRVRSIDPAVTNSSAGAATDPSEAQHPTLADTDPGDATLKNVLSAYKGTVQSLPHYREEYDETLTENLSAELGQDIVTSLATNKVLVPATKRALVERSQEAIDSRTNLIEAITAEIDSLTDAQADLEAIETRRQKLRTHLEGVERNQSEAAFDVLCSLRELESEVDDVAQRRQKTLQNPPVKESTTSTGRTDHMEFYEYLYGVEGVPRYPVLSAAAELGSTIRAGQEQVIKYM